VNSSDDFADRGRDDPRYDHRRDVSEVGRCPRLAIIGLGPRGLTVLERICANLRWTAPHTVVEVVLIDNVRTGTGAVWRTDQSERLLMNTVASQITVFTDETVRMAGPVQMGPSVYEWARYIRTFGTADDSPETVREEASALTPDSYPTRAFYGHYLLWAYEHIRRLSQDFLKVTEIVETAVDLHDEQGRQVVRLADGQRIDDLDAVVLTQGHLPTAYESNREFARLVRQGGLHHLGPGNAADVDLDPVVPGEPVIIQGLGLTFFDYLALLTEGRGGRYIDLGNRLEYLSSGQEPVIHAGSRRGVPYHGRGENQKGVAGRHRPVLLTPARIRELRHRASTSGDLVFRRDVWPLIAKEVEVTYYSRLLRDRCNPQALQEFCSRYISTPWGGTAERALLDEHGVDAHRWDWDAVTQPVRGKTFADRSTFRHWLLSYLEEDLRAAYLGNVHGAVKSALDVLRDLRNEVRMIVDHAGVTGDSYRDDLDRWYTPMNAFLSIGPPAHRIAEMVALIRAGVLSPVGPEMHAALDGDHFSAHSPRVGNSQISARCLIDARLPEPDIRRTTDPLLTSLRRRREVRCYALPNPDGSAYRTGALEVTPDHRLVDLAGHTHPRRFAFGVPTEKVRWVTAAGPRPNVDSVALADADNIARAMLKLASIALQPMPCIGCPT
jgi:hypothetical protein